MGQAVCAHLLHAEGEGGKLFLSRRFDLKYKPQTSNFKVGLQEYAKVLICFNVMNVF